MHQEAQLTRRTVVKRFALAFPALAVATIVSGCSADEKQRATATPSPAPTIPPSDVLSSGRSESWPVRAVSLSPNTEYKGVVPLTVRLDLAAGIPSEVGISLGRSSRVMTRIDQTDIWQADPWDTTIKLRIPGVASPSNFCAWVQVTASYDDVSHSTTPYPVYTANYDYGELPDPGWMPELAWAADYSSMDAWLASHMGAVVGEAYSSLIDDPVHGGARKAIRTTLPDSARFDADQPTSAPRFQAPQPTGPPWNGISEGQEFYVGFAIYVPLTNSSALGSGGFPTVGISDPLKTNRHIAIFQMFGPQAVEPSRYPAGRGAITIIDANRNSEADPIDRFHIDANQLNGGDPGLLVDFSYNRGAWTDIVIGIKMSADVRRGWIEVYLNQGEHKSVQPVPLFGGLTRLPRVTAWPQWSNPAVPPTVVDGELITGGSSQHRTDMQIYRGIGEYEEVTLLHTAHRVGPTPESVDPRSYA